ncbi:TPA: hypothetical protein KOS98_003793 [Clostridioides difficile]|uniref:hypothetical protein n=1 Tax=Clostridioides difficile TaxID=1496 RepID=UPI00097FDE54|nr:hypothetical protein [Clostridioides difficile]SJT88059.1 Uncharacterised protein [Clostridioides difficile]HBF6471970.1 hypothetical protein [Clostridioides difficile]
MDKFEREEQMALLIKRLVDFYNEEEDELKDFTYEELLDLLDEKGVDLGEFPDDDC